MSPLVVELELELELERKRKRKLERNLKLSGGLMQWRIQDLPKGRGTDHGERAEREPKRGSGGGAPSGVQGQCPWWGVRWA